MKPLIDLDPKYLEMIMQIVHKNLPENTKVFLFGSRATNRAKPFSDIDLLIDAGPPLSLAQLSSLNVDFDESLIPYKVDIADSTTINKEFRLAIQDQLIPLTPTGIR